MRRARSSLRAPGWLTLLAHRRGFRLTPIAAAPVHVDELTGLRTRDAFTTHLAEILEMAATDRMAVLRVDIDDLERINEGLSHAAGDVVIATISRRLVDAIGTHERVARISGGAFVAMVHDVESAESVAGLAHTIRRVVSEPVVTGGHVTQSTVSIGISIEDGSRSADHAIRNATLALRRAKDGGGDRVEFAESDLARQAMERLELEEAMRQALLNNEFRAWYQPIVDFNDRRVVGYEALIRWITSDGQHIYPGEFIPVAESNGLVPELDIIVLAQSLGLLAQLPEDQFLSVNVSPASLTRPDFVRRAAELLEFTNVDLQRLHLEVTETALPSDLDVVRSAMLHLSLGGAQWYFDDFGTGYSSMSNLGELPVDGLKLDMSFTRGIHAGDETSIRLAYGLLGLARGLDLATVAEGVETDAVADILREQGWDHGQGWLYGKAEPLNTSDAA